MKNKKVYDELDPIIDAVGGPEAFLKLWEQVKPKLFGTLYNPVIIGTAGEIPIYEEREPEDSEERYWKNVTTWQERHSITPDDEW